MYIVKHSVVRFASHFSSGTVRHSLGVCCPREIFRTQSKRSRRSNTHKHHQTTTTTWRKINKPHSRPEYIFRMAANTEMPTMGGNWRPEQAVSRHSNRPYGMRHLRADKTRERERESKKGKRIKRLWSKNEFGHTLGHPSISISFRYKPFGCVTTFAIAKNCCHSRNTDESNIHRPHTNWPIGPFRISVKGPWIFSLRIHLFFVRFFGWGPPSVAVTVHRHTHKHTQHQTDPFQIMAFGLRDQSAERKHSWIIKTMTDDDGGKWLRFCLDSGTHTSSGWTQIRSKLFPFKLITCNYYWRYIETFVLFIVPPHTKC